MVKERIGLSLYLWVLISRIVAMGILYVHPHILPLGVLAVAPDHL